MGVGATIGIKNLMTSVYISGFTSKICTQIILIYGKLEIQALPFKYLRSYISSKITLESYVLYTLSFKRNEDMRVEIF